MPIFCITLMDLWLAGTVKDQVQQYARQLAAGEAKFAALRDTQGQLEKKKVQLQGELNGLIERADF